jgi:hypothetical protein
VDAGFVRGLLSIGKTKSYDVIAEIERTSEEPDVVLRIGNLVRVREDALMRWISGQGVAGGPTLPPPTARTMPPLRRTRRRVGQDACGDPSGP